MLELLRISDDFGQVTEFYAVFKALLRDDLDQDEQQRLGVVMVREPVQT